MLKLYKVWHRNLKYSKTSMLHYRPLWVCLKKFSDENFWRRILQLGVCRNRTSNIPNPHRVQLNSSALGNTEFSMLMSLADRSLYWRRTPWEGGLPWKAKSLYKVQDTAWMACLTQERYLEGSKLGVLKARPWATGNMIIWRKEERCTMK